MGVVICKKHGQQGFYEVCEHLYEDLEMGIYPEMKLFPLVRVKICNECYQQLEINELPEISFDDFTENPDIIDDEFEKVLREKYDQLERRIVCRICDLKIQLMWARQNGLEDPFEAFENTLTYAEKPTIDKLKKYLLENFDFEQSIVNIEDKALFIFEGNIQEPLLLKIYYVTDSVRQEMLISLIDVFFKKQECIQRKIQFFERENWITKHMGNGIIKKSRGPEKLIREIVVR